jgi:hypothetical protein
MILGWLVLLIPGVAFTAGGLLLVLVGPSFNGKFNAEALIPLIIGGLLLWGAYETNPFLVSMK